jgi:hypothetical protein
MISALKIKLKITKAFSDLRLVRRGERLAKIICIQQATTIFLHFKIAFNNSCQLFFSHFSFIFTQHIVQNLVLFRRVGILNQPYNFKTIKNIQ